MADEVASEQFTEAGQGAGALQEIRDALLRLDDGSYGKCTRGPIDVALSSCVSRRS